MQQEQEGTQMLTVDGRPLFEALGGIETLRKVHKVFYDKIYEDPWIGQFFKAIDQKHIENQQTDFMAQAMGGPKNYFGKFPIPAHQHMFITIELFELREKLLLTSLKEVGVAQPLIELWIRIDQSFRNGIKKETLEDCKRRYTTD